MSIKELKEREKEQRRQYIVDAAEKLFISKCGYDNVTMGDIADKVGLNKSTLYLYFKNKEALYFALARRVTKRIYDVFEVCAGSGKTGMEKIEVMENVDIAFIKKYPEYAQAGDSLEPPKRLDSKYMMESEDENAKEIIRIYEGMFDIVCDAIKAGINDGTIRQDVDPVAAATILTLIGKSVQNIPPEYKKMMEDRGTDFPKFIKEVANFKRHMLMNKGVKED